DPRRRDTRDDFARRERSRAGTAIVAAADWSHAGADRDARAYRRAVRGGILLRAPRVRGPVVDGRRVLLGKRYRSMALRRVTTSNSRKPHGCGRGGAGVGTIDAGSGQLPSYGGQLGTASSAAG